MKCCQRIRVNIRDLCLKPINIGQRYSTTITQNFPECQIRGLYTVRAFIDRQNTRIAVILRRPGFLNKAHPAMNLHTDRAHFTGHIRAPGLHDRC